MGMLGPSWGQQAWTCPGEGAVEGLSPPGPEKFLGSGPSTWSGAPCASWAEARD